MDVSLFLQVLFEYDEALAFGWNFEPLDFIKELSN